MITQNISNVIFVILLSLSSIKWIQLISNIFKFRYDFWKGVVVDVEPVLSLLSIVCNNLESLIELELNLLSFWRIHELFVVGCKVLEFWWIGPSFCI